MAAIGVYYEAIPMRPWAAPTNNKKYSGDKS